MATKKCKTFCVNYEKEMSKIAKNIRQKKKLPLLQKPSKAMMLKTLKKCKKRYCNPQCLGYDDDFNFGWNPKKLKNGFQTKLSKKQREILKKKGALSACTEDFDEYKIK